MGRACDHEPGVPRTLYENDFGFDSEPASAQAPHHATRRKNHKTQINNIKTPWTVFFEADAGAHGYHMLIGAVAPCPCMLGTLRPLSRLLYVCFTSPGKGIEKADSVTLDGHKVSE